MATMAGMGPKVLFMTLVLAAAGCAVPAVDVEVDATFNTYEQTEIARAAEDWNRFAGSRVVTIAPKSDWLITRAEVPTGHYGYSQKKRQLLRVDPSAPSDQVYAVALHEFGHALGLGHVKQGVMDPDHQTIVFSAEDKAECESAGVCGSGRMVLRRRMVLERRPCQ